VARTVLIFLGIPLAAGYLTRVIGLQRRGRDWYENHFLPRIAPITLYGLLFTIVLLFALQGHQITGHPLDVVRIAPPLLAYFALMFGDRRRDRGLRGDLRRRRPTATGPDSVSYRPAPSAGRRRRRPAVGDPAR
jgi:hypothetical protein